MNTRGIAGNLSSFSPSTRSYPNPWVAAAVLLLVSAGSGCRACMGQSSAVIVTQVPDLGPREDHQIRCTCIGISTVPILPDGGTRLPPFNLDLCAPADLNTALGASLTDSEFDQGVKLFCESRAVTLLHSLVGMVSDNRACGIIGISCEPGQINSNDAGTDGGSFAVAPNPLCDKPCDNIPCVVGLLSGDIVPPDAGPVNCFSLSAVDVDTGEIDPTACSCTAMRGCGVTQGPAICQPMNVVTDPPTTSTGVLTYSLGQPSTVDLDPSQSSVTTTVVVPVCDPTGNICVNLADTERSAAHGNLTLYGRPCPAAECDLRVGFAAYPDNTSFHFACIAGFCLADAHLSQMSIVGGTGSSTVHVDADGHAMIAAGTMNLVADGIRDGERFRVETSNPSTILLIIDFANKSVKIPGGATLALGQGSSATLQMSGSISNQPPRAAVVADQVTECTSFAGAEVTLDGSATSDPDGDIFTVNWWRGAPFSSHLSHDVAPKVIAPVGTTVYSLSVTDSRLVTDVEKTSVTVRDTQPPALTATVNPGCLWPPNHQMVLFQFGNGLDATATDACDPAPVVEVVDVSSDQGSLALGSGNSTPDVRWGTGAVCVRAERSGASSADRVYTVKLQASDHAGNSATKAVYIRVPHDLGQGGRADCQQVDPARVVPDDDPRCVKNLPHGGAVSAPTPSRALEHTRRVDHAGCAAQPGGTDSAIFGLAVALLVLRRVGGRKAN